LCDLAPQQLYIKKQQETHGEVEKRGEKSLKKGLTKGARFGKIVEHSARAGAAP
jgi:hypothetical protein